LLFNSLLITANGVEKLISSYLSGCIIQFACWNCGFCDNMISLLTVFEHPTSNKHLKSSFSLS
jgi:hypothetical protein